MHFHTLNNDLRNCKFEDSKDVRNCGMQGLVEGGLGVVLIKGI